MTRLLGAVLAGGQAVRFGSDKALAQLDGQTLLDLAVARLRAWCDDVVVIGRGAPGRRCLADWPAPGMGPLAGVAGALHGAQALGFDAVLTCGVDSLDLPDDLPGLLAPGPAYVSDQPVVGLWPASAFPAAEVILTVPGRHSMRAFADAIGARAVVLAVPSANINTPEDLAALRGRSGD